MSSKQRRRIVLISESLSDVVLKKNRGFSKLLHTEEHRERLRQFEPTGSAETSGVTRCMIPLFDVPRLVLGGCDWWICGIEDVSWPHMDIGTFDHGRTSGGY